MLLMWVMRNQRPPHSQLRRNPACNSVEDNDRLSAGCPHHLKIAPSHAAAPSVPIAFMAASLAAKRPGKALHAVRLGFAIGALGFGVDARQKALAMPRNGRCHPLHLAQVHADAHDHALQPTRNTAIPRPGLDPLHKEHIRTLAKPITGSEKANAPRSGYAWQLVLPDLHQPIAPVPVRLQILARPSAFPPA